MNRKSFLKQSAFSLVGLAPLVGRMPAFGSSPITPAKGRSTSFRTIEYNIFNGAIGYQGINGRNLPDNEDTLLLRTARELGQIPRRMALELALYKPDILSFCESASKPVVMKIQDYLGMKHCAYFPGAKDGKGHYPGTILTNYEILSMENRPFVNKKNNDPEELFTRHWGKATLRLPNNKTLTVHTAHLWPFNKVDKDREIRMAEVNELVKAIHYDLDHNNADSVLLQGDLNQAPDTPEHQKFLDGGLSDIFTEAGSGNGFTATSNKPHTRIDYIYAIGAIAKKATTCRPLYEGHFRMNNDDPKAFALSDHIPVLADFTI